MYTDTTKGILYSVAAYVGWGLLPVYWHLLNTIPSEEILAHRIFWSFVTVLLILFYFKRVKQFKSVLQHKKVLLALLTASLLISSNWFIYIWAVNHEHVIEASLGYYINPLLNVILGLTVLKERVNLWQWIAIILAAAGVAVLTFEFGQIPWIALALALTFAFYGLVKKLAPVEAVVGLGYETAFVTPIACLYLWMLQSKGNGSLGHISFELTVILLMSGVATTLPLLWFAEGAKKLPFSMLAFIQYISPTISLLLGIFMFKEPFSKVHAISFSLIWCAIVIYSLSKANLKQQIKYKFKV